MSSAGGMRRGAARRGDYLCLNVRDQPNLGEPCNKFGVICLYCPTDMLIDRVVYTLHF